MTFLEAVNRMLRLSTLMQWDDDDITTFSNTQHAGNISLCRQAVQHVLNDLVADEFLWSEDATGNITTVSGTRTYSLASNFVQLQDTKPWFFKLSGIAGTDAEGNFLVEYPGGENLLMKQVLQYTSQTGTPQWFYFTADQEIGMYPIPDSVDVYRYHYEKNVMVNSESDELPFDSDQKGYAFVDMATRIFTFLFTRQPIEGIENDIIYKRAKGALLSLSKKKDPIKRYGYKYV
jgi:hypothetical protein